MPHIKNRLTRLIRSYASVRSNKKITFVIMPKENFECSLRANYESHLWIHNHRDASSCGTGDRLGSKHQHGPTGIPDVLDGVTGSDESQPALVIFRDPVQQWKSSGIQLRHGQGRARRSLRRHASCLPAPMRNRVQRRTDPGKAGASLLLPARLCSWRSHTQKRHVIEGPRCRHILSGSIQTIACAGTSR